MTCSRIGTDHLLHTLPVGQELTLMRGGGLLKVLFCFENQVAPHSTPAGGQRFRFLMRAGEGPGKEITAVVTE